MEKKNKWAFSIALSALGYFRMVLVITSIVAWTEREWLLLVVIIITYGLTTIMIDKVLDYPSNETVKALTEAVKSIEEGE